MYNRIINMGNSDDAVHRETYNSVVKAAEHFQEVDTYR